MNTKPLRAPDIKTRMLPDGHVVLVSSTSEWVHTLTPLGALVWEFCDGTNDLAKIADSIRAIPNVEADPELQSQISELIEELDDAGFLRE